MSVVSLKTDCCVCSSCCTVIQDLLWWYSCASRSDSTAGKHLSESSPPQPDCSCSATESIGPVAVCVAAMFLHGGKHMHFDTNSSVITAARRNISPNQKTASARRHNSLFNRRQFCWASHEHGVFRRAPLVNRRVIVGGEGGGGVSFGF